MWGKVPWRVNFPGFWPKILMILGDSYPISIALMRNTLSIFGISTSCSVMAAMDLGKIARAHANSPSKGTGFAPHLPGFMLKFQSFVDLRDLPGFFFMTTSLHSTLQSKTIMSGLNLQEIHDFAIDLAKKAGKMILEGSNKRLSSNTTSTSEKKNCIR